MTHIRTILRWIGWPTVHIDVFLWLIGVKLVINEPAPYGVITPIGRTWISLVVGRRGPPRSAQWLLVSVMSMWPMLPLPTEEVKAATPSCLKFTFRIFHRRVLPWG
uniref:Uncharacterized protein n=1 Tax=viral metagenome TaxID=1070528 RepID=A0A6M3KIT5_9ZZZZ